MPPIFTCDSIPDGQRTTAYEEHGIRFDNDAQTQMAELSFGERKEEVRGPILPIVAHRDDRLVQGSDRQVPQYLD